MNAKSDSSVVVSDQEVICCWMEPKSLEAPGQTTPKALLGSPWWDWSIGFGAFPKPLTLDLLRQVEERLGNNDRLRSAYVYALWNAVEPGPLMSDRWALIHASAAAKIKALADVLRGLKPHETESASNGE